MRGEYQKPEGLSYFQDFISLSEELEILKFIEELTYKEVVIYNQVAKRTVKHYGYTYNYETVTLTPGEPFPLIIKSLAVKCAMLANLPPESIVQCLISNYPVEATIGWHRDKLLFGPKVMGISLLSSCLMRFQKKEEGTRFVYEQKLEPRSFYILSGSARYQWEHSIPAVKSQRYSITFRTL